MEALKITDPDNHEDLCWGLFHCFQLIKIIFLINKLKLDPKIQRSSSQNGKISFPTRSNLKQLCQLFVPKNHLPIKQHWNNCVYWIWISICYWHWHCLCLNLIKSHQWRQPMSMCDSRWYTPSSSATALVSHSTWRQKIRNSWNEILVLLLVSVCFQLL